jgi:UDP-glucose 4-epimerase
VRALVTGGAGFIGASLVERLLAEDHTVDVLDNLSAGSLARLAGARAAAGRSLTIHSLDVRQAETTDLIARRRPEVIWHLAGQTSVAASLTEPLLDAEVNIIGTLRVLDGARAAGTRKVVVASSGCAVYGDVPGPHLPIKENQARRPRAPHGIAKHAVDSYLVAYRETYALEFTSLVLGSVYGPGGGGVVGAWVRHVVMGEPRVLEGDGSQTRDFVFVDDVVDALARAADRGDGMVLNVGTGVETSLIHLGEVIEAAVTAHSPGMVPSLAGVVAAPARAVGVRRMALDASRAAAELGWKPWTPLEEGVAATLVWAARTRRAAQG